MKPKISYIDSRRTGGGNHNTTRDALSYVLKEDYGLDVFLHSGPIDFLNNLDKGKFSLDDLMMVLANEGRMYCDDGMDLIQRVKNQTKSRLPIVMLESFYDELMFPIEKYDYSNITKLSGTMNERLDKLSQLVNDEKKNFLEWRKENSDVMERKKAGEEIKMIDHAYRTNYGGMNEEKAIGIPCFNDRVVAEYIRCRLLPGSEVKKEFDDVLPRKPRLPEVAGNEYSACLQKLRNLSAEERKELNYALLRNKGIEPDESGGTRVTRTSSGDDVIGYAIDPITSLDIETSGYGQHRIARMRLSHVACDIDKMRGKETILTDSHSRVIPGLIHENIEGYSVPIVELLYLNDPFKLQHAVTAGNQIIGKRKYLPVDQDAVVIDDKYFENRIR